MLPSNSQQELVSLEGVLRARERWAGAIDIEIVALIDESVLEHPGAPGSRARSDAAGGRGDRGSSEPRARQLRATAHLEALFDIAEELGSPVDVHVDFDADPAQKALERLAGLTLRRGLRGMRSRQPLLCARHLPAGGERNA
jgi:cytosine/creatinine deaminase